MSLKDVIHDIEGYQDIQRDRNLKEIRVRSQHPEGQLDTILGMLHPRVSD